jgi:peptide/nickel transport system permease protein
MIAYFLRRLLQASLIVIGVSVVTFTLLYLLPADPARMVAGRTASAEQVEQVRAQLGLDLPPWRQYARYFTNLLGGDLGRSYLQRTEVSVLIAARLPATLLLMLGAIACELAIGVTLGIIAGTRRGSMLDQCVMVGAFVFVSMPQFVVALTLLYVFAYWLGWFPIGGFGQPQHLVLPAVTLGLLGGGWYARVTRSSVIRFCARFHPTARPGLID